MSAPVSDPRWHLYRLLSDPTRLKLLALAAAEELSVGELAEVLRESQPTVSRHLAPLRQARLVADRRQGTRTLVRLAEPADSDPVVSDALRTGSELCRQEGCMARLGDVLRARDQKTREFFEQPASRDPALHFAPELPAYLSALSFLIEPRRTAVDAGTGEGALLDVLSPIFERVIAIDRSRPQLDRARMRASRRGYRNVSFVHGEMASDAAQKAVGAGGDLVMAARMLHHAAVPREGMQALSKLVRPGGWLVVLDYCRHEDESLREQQADVWMGFEEQELKDLARQANLIDIRVAPLPPQFVTNPVDGHIAWQALLAKKRAAP